MRIAPTATRLSTAPISTAEPTTLNASRPTALIRRALEGLTSAALNWTPRAFVSVAIPRISVEMAVARPLG